MSDISRLILNFKIEDIDIRSLEIDGNTVEKISIKIPNESDYKQIYRRVYNNKQLDMTMCCDLIYGIDIYKILTEHKKNLIIRKIDGDYKKQKFFDNYINAHIINNQKNEKANDEKTNLIETETMAISFKETEIIEARAYENIDKNNSEKIIEVKFSHSEKWFEVFNYKKGFENQLGTIKRYEYAKTLIKLNENNCSILDFCLVSEKEKEILDLYNYKVYEREMKEKSLRR